MWHLNIYWLSFISTNGRASYQRFAFEVTQNNPLQVLTQVRSKGSALEMKLAQHTSRLRIISPISGKWIINLKQAKTVNNLYFDNFNLIVNPI